MPTETKQQVKYRTPLRQAQRDLTRGRIKDAARNLFYEKHYDATTMDEIAAAAGLRRSTLYLHYKDKADILAEVIEDYAPRARDVLATLPGPAPTVKQVLRWIRKVAKFVAEERAPLSILLELRRDHAYTGTLEELTNLLLTGLGANNPQFAQAGMAKADPALRARGLLLLQQLTYSCELYLDDPADLRNKALFMVTAEDFAAFLAPD
ncbi:MAG: TetR/AcrR family transcriptional regulator [Novosphingobium sp.]|nr:TetR/AcrR family transcriptional regulator [Novosphingobium sp.]